jgi:hypothetical protein
MIKPTPIIDVNTGKIIKKYDKRKKKKKEVRDFMDKMYEETKPSHHGLNPYPRQTSSWRRFAEAFDIGILDLDTFAMMMGYDDLADLDVSISPRALFQRQVIEREDSTFFRALREASLRARDKTGYEITHILETEVF